MGQHRIRNGRLRLAALLFLILFPVIAQAQDPLEESLVSLKENQRPLHLVLDNLTDQTGFYFTFDSRLINSTKKVSIHAEQSSLRSVLNELLPDSTLRYRIIHRNIVIFPDKDVLPGNPVVSPEQDTAYRITGFVRDRSGRRPLAYATIGVVDTRFGTITNEAGEFKLVLPDSVRNPIISVSHLGFSTGYYPVSGPMDEPVEIRMEKQYISIQEVIIRHRDPVQLISESLKRVGDNYVDQPSGTVAYYREKVQRNEKILIFSEAVMEMARPAYTSQFRSDRVRLLKGRKIKSVAEEDTILFRISAGIDAMLTLDLMRNLPEFLEQDFKSYYRFTFNDIVPYQNRLVYVIGFEPREYAADALFRGEIFLDQESLALVAADFEYDPERIRNQPEMFVTRRSPRLKVRPIEARYRVEYRRTGDRYSLGQVQGNVSFRVRKRRQWIASKYSISLEMAVTHTDPGNPPDIPFREQLWTNMILSDQDFNYDPEFWGSYNTIVAESSLTEALENIEEAIEEISIR